MSEIERQFDEEMRGIYWEAKASCGYNATRFLQMVQDAGGLATARRLLAAPATSDGYAALFEHGRLDLTVEALVLRAPWRQLFTEAELKVAKRRLPAAYHPKD